MGEWEAAKTRGHFGGELPRAKLLTYSVKGTVYISKENI